MSTRARLAAVLAALVFVAGCGTSRPTTLSASNDSGIPVLVMHGDTIVATIAPGFRGRVTDVDGWGHPRWVQLTTQGGTELGDPWDASGGEFSLDMGECGEIFLWLGSPDPSLDPAPAIPIDACAAQLALDLPVDCGPIANLVLCRKAVEVASTAKLNPPPVAAAWIRRPRADDACSKAMFHACGSETIIVVIQSGDTLQDVALAPTSDGWGRLDLRR